MLPILKNMNNSRNKKRRWLFLGLGLAATGALSYFGIGYWKRKTQKAMESEMQAVAPATAEARPNKGKKPAIKKVPAKSKASAPKNSPVINVRETAKKIQAALMKRDFNNVLSLLKTIGTVANYTEVSKVFSEMRLNGVRQTLVNGALSVFKDEKQKAAIRAVFSAMGLKYDGKKWSLSGIDEKLLITNRATKVWKNPRTSVPVPAQMVLGKEVARRGSFTVFKNDNLHFLVESAHVNDYNK
jgi:hypothetical protein